MPGLNFDYTKFLREQHEKYIKKYGDEPIKSAPNPDPINGYGGHVPYYRNSLHELQVVRSLVRCISSPMKPTTPTGYRSKSRQFYRPEDEDSQSQRGSQKAESPKVPKSPSSPNRIRSAPAAISREGRPHDKQPSPHPSHISMMASGSSELLKKDAERPKTAYSVTRSRIEEPKQKVSTPKSSSRLSDVSIPPIRQATPVVVSKHPTGYPQTLYGASYWYAWPDMRPPTTESAKGKRPGSFAQDRRLTRKDGVIYHRHEGMVPKYLGYVPSYKFRHGSTFGVLTVNATHYSVANKLAEKAK